MIETIISTVKPILEPIAASIVANRFNDWREKKQIQDAVNRAFDVWIFAIIKNLQVQEYDDKDLLQFFELYQKDIEKFLQDSKVADELLKPFSVASTEYKIDHKLLMQRWKGLYLRELPEEFYVASVCSAYLRRLKNERIVTDELRPLFLAQLAQDKANYLQSIRGVWPDFDLDNYAERVKKRYKVLDLSALTPPSRDDVDDGSILLKDVFVPQMVRQSPPPRELPKEISNKLHEKGELNLDELPEDFEAKYFKDLQDRWMQSEPESVLTVVDKPENKHLVLLGDPGSGKSTLARYLLLSVLDDNSHVFAGHLPLLVELRNYIATKNCKGFLEYFHDLGITEGYTINHVELKEQLETRPCLIIFDGLDEIFDLRLRDKVTQEIIGFSGEYPQTRVVVTSRIIGYQGKALQAADFCEYTLLDLNQEQIKTFAQGWFNLVFRDKPEEADSRYQRIETALQNSPAIRQLAGNPLLLTMIAIIAKHQELPRERAKLYEHATKVLCHHWDVTGHKISVSETPADFMQEDDKLELLRRIAWRMQASGNFAGNFILRDDLEDEIASYLRNRWQLSETEIGRITHAMIAQLRERNFILCLYGPQVYGFVHRTFLEYFCAAEIVYRFEKQQTLSLDELNTYIFLANFRNETWHEVLRLICGMVDAKFTSQVVDLMILNTEIEIKDQDLEKWIYNLLKDLIFAKTCLNEANKPVESSIKCLYSKWKNFAVNKDSSVREAAIQFLPEYYQNHPETYSFLQQVVQKDKDEYVRAAAVLSLAEHHKERSEVLPMLQKMIIDDEEASEVRSAAVGGLAILYYDDTWQKLLSEDFSRRMYHWLDSKAIIDEERVEKAAKELKLPPETIRQHYEDIAKEIPLQLSWKAD